MKIPPKAFFACKHFGTGVLIATAFVHLVPTAFASLSDPCLPDVLIEDYPAMPGVIMMFSMFCLFVIEVWLKAKTGGHSHGGPTGEQQKIHHHAPQQTKGQIISGPMQHSAYRNDLSRNNTATSLPPYENGAGEYMNTYQEKLMAR